MNKFNELTNFEHNNLLREIMNTKKILIFHIHLGKENPEASYNEIMNIFKEIILAANSVWFSVDESNAVSEADKFLNH